MAPVAAPGDYDNHYHHHHRRHFPFTLGTLDPKHLPKINPKNPPMAQLIDFLANLHLHPANRHAKHLHPHPPHHPHIRARSLSSTRSDDSSMAMVFQQRRRHQPMRGRSPLRQVLWPKGGIEHDDDSVLESEFESDISDTIVGHDHGHDHHNQAHQHGHGHGHAHGHHRGRPINLEEAKRFEQERVLSPFGTEVLQNEVERRWEEKRAKAEMMEEAERARRRLERRVEKERRRGSWDWEMQHFERARRNRRERRESVVRVERVRGRRH